MTYVSLFLLTHILVLLLVIYFRQKQLVATNNPELIKCMLQAQFKDNRQELATALRQNREELSAGIDRLTLKLEEKLTLISDGLNKNAKDNREELT